jgi:hypothetical protein
MEPSLFLCGSSFQPRCFSNGFIAPGKPLPQAQKKNREPSMKVCPITSVALFLLSGLIGWAAEAADTAPNELPGLSGRTPEKIYLAAGYTDKGEEATIGYPDEQATIGDPGEQATVGDPGEQATVGDPGEKAGIGDPGEAATIGDPGEKSSF